MRNQATRRALACAAAVLTAAPAAAQDARCLWADLPTVVQLRIELAALRGEPMPDSVSQRFGPEEVAAHLSACGYGGSARDMPRDVALLARVWGAYAALGAADARLSAAGLSADAADAALAVTAPEGRRAAMGEELMRGPDEPLTAADAAPTALRAAALSVQALQGAPLSPGAKRALAEYLTARLTVMGLEAGAAPP